MNNINKQKVYISCLILIIGTLILIKFAKAKPQPPQPEEKIKITDIGVEKV